jgi:histidinol-phosphate aminotransferase
MKSSILSKLETYSPPLENRSGKIKLDFNENSSGIPELLFNKIKSFDKQLLSTYPEYNKLYYELSKYLKIKKEQLILSNGSDDIIRLIFMAFLDKNEEVIIPSPTFSMFKINANIVGAKIINIDVLSKDFTKQVIKKINECSPKLVVIVNPNNPTGTSISLRDLKQILTEARLKNCLVLVDEAYFEFNEVTAIDLITKFDSLIITRTFSKAYGLAGLRLGYGCANKGIITILKKIISPYPVSSFSVFVALEAIKNNNYVDKYCLNVKTNKFILIKRLRSLNFEVFDGDANFIILKSKEYRSILKLLDNNNILVRDISKSMNNCLRITVGCKKDNEFLIKCLKQFIQKKNIILFDLDGTIANVNYSYDEVIRQTVFYFTKQEITNKYIQSFRQKSKINNDWKLTFEIIKELIIKRKNSEKKIEKSFQFSFKEVKFIFQEKYLGKKTIKKNKFNFTGLINEESLLIDKEIFKNLSKKNILGIITGRPKNEALYFLKKFNILKYFKAVITLDDVKNDKPSPEGIIKALKQILSSKDLKENNIEKTSNSKIFYVGDTVTDIEASLSANIIPIGFIPEYYNNKNKQKKILIKSGAIAVIEESSEILYKINNVILKDSNKNNIRTLNNSKTNIISKSVVKNKGDNNER